MSDLTLLSSTAERKEEYGNGFTATVVSISGDPAASALVSAVGANYNRILDRERPTAETLEAMIGEKVTLTTYGENMLGAGLIVAQEGKLFAGSRGGLAILPKGKRSKGFVVKPEKVIDVFPGYVADEAKILVDQVVGGYPILRNLTRERLEELPRNSKTCSLALLGRNPAWGAPECIWLIGEYWKDDDICETNVMLIRPEFAFSETGSCYGSDLLNNRALGEIVGFQPISYADAAALCDVDFDEALARVFFTQGKVAA